MIYAEVLSYLAENKENKAFVNGGLAKRSLTLGSLVENSEEIKIYGNEFYKQGVKDFIEKLNEAIWKNGKKIKVLLTNFDENQDFYKFINRESGMGNIETRISTVKNPLITHSKYFTENPEKVDFILGDDSKYVFVFNDGKKPKTLGNFNDKKIAKRLTETFDKFWSGAKPIS